MGKVAVPDYILKKSGPLTPGEAAIMRTHTETGAQTIRSVIDSLPDPRFLKMAEQITRSHHEWYDGRGYPEGSKADAIPLSARIVAVADVYDAITTRRVYKEPMPHERAVEIITKSAGSQFDPDVVDVFRRCESEFHQLARDLADDASDLPSVPASCPPPREIALTPTSSPE